MKLIVAVSENWGIGKDNGLLFSIPTDMRFFRETTKGHTVVMGRKTLESFPNGQPLKNRTNIVLSKNLPEGEGYIVVRSLEELLDTIIDNMQVNYIFLAICGVVLPIVSQLGDLIASLIKREYGVKDYGKIFPGDGGVMDRFDSVVAVSTILLILCISFPPFAII